ncbi:TorF family putative porin [Pseudoalteromonas xiamenensis]|uniref:TorF family putative porin n=1 Tax=Pseudoalteromonas xiamenensis TaxID=882626 RepID=UPI0027E4C987|nr:TorF family putative porin [Pseudoalteromonas xiamenensis]WMN58893.1 TorF family putative porin [Pseudoalteromonas xiamenensis]
MTTKKIVLATCALLALSSQSALAGVEANVAASSNYFWRGITQTGDKAAVSGGLDYSHESGFYVGTWMSTIDFGEEASAGYELDVYGGFAWESNGIGYDVGYLYYAYPDAAENIDFGEIYGSVTWEWLTLKASYTTFVDEASAPSEDMLYLEANASFTVLNETTLDIHIAQSSGDTIKDWYGEDDSYMDYGISLTKSGITLGLKKVDLKADDDIKVFASYGVSFEL